MAIRRGFGAGLTEVVDWFCAVAVMRVGNQVIGTASEVKCVREVVDSLWKTTSERVACQPGKPTGYRINLLRDDAVRLVVAVGVGRVVPGLSQLLQEGGSVAGVVSEPLSGLIDQARQGICGEAVGHELERKEVQVAGVGVCELVEVRDPVNCPPIGPDPGCLDLDRYLRTGEVVDGSAGADPGSSTT